MDDRVEGKLDKIAIHIGNIDVTLARQEITLAEHVRRTDALEKKLEPIEKHVTIFQGIMKFIAAIGTIIGVVHGFLKFKGL